MAQSRSSDAGLAGSASSAPSGTMTQQNLNQIVIEYLSKKGYSRTEAMLRTESASHDPEGKPLVMRAEDEGGRQWLRAMNLLEGWIDGILDIYRPELKRLLWPVFVYSYLELVERFYVEDAKTFMRRFRDRFEEEHIDDLRQLEPISLPEHLLTASIAKIYRSARYRLTLSSPAYYQMTLFLDTKEREGGSVIMSIINNRLNVHTIDRASDATRSLATMMNRAKLREDFPGEDEGIPGHNPGSANTEAAPTAAVLTRLKLGPLPLEPELLDDVLAELADEDARRPPRDGQSGLVQEMEHIIKSEDADEAPNRTDLPLPPSRARDVLMEVLKVKEHRDRVPFDTGPDRAPPGVSVCMFTFHNAKHSITCIRTSDDNRLIAIGTSESYIRIWNMDGSPMTSLLPDEKPQASRRLIGHSGPVYNISFSPSAHDPDHASDSKPISPTAPLFLLSCSADKTIRLWHLGLWQCLAVYRGHLGPVWDVSWGPFGHYFLTGSHDKTAALWSTENIAPLRLFAGHDQDVDTVAFHPNGSYVFSASSDRTVRMWTITNAYCVRMLTGHTGNITSLACSPNGKILGSADDAGTIILWDLASGRLIKRMRGHDKSGIWSLSWSAESTLILSGAADGTVRVWDATKRFDATTGKVVSEGGAGTKVDAGPPAAATGGTGTGKKKAKAVVITPDQIGAFPTKKSPVFHVRFTRMNLALAAGCYLP